MKTFNRTSLPETIKYNGREYKYSAKDSGIYSSCRSTPQNDRFVVVAVLSRRLKDVRDLHGNLYKPTQHIFIEANPEYIVFRVFRKSGRRKTIEKNLTREQAQRLVQSFPNSNTSMVCFNKQ